MHDPQFLINSPARRWYRRNRKLVSAPWAKPDRLIVVGRIRCNEPSDFSAVEYLRMLRHLLAPVKVPKTHDLPSAISLVLLAAF